MPSLFGETAPSPLPHDWQIAPCLDLINSLWSDHLGHGHSYDRLPDPRFRRALLKRWQFKVADPDDPKAQVELAHLRAVLRRALERYISGRPLTAAVVRELEAIVNRAPMRLQIEPKGGGTLVHSQRPRRDWDAVMAEIATSAVRLMSEGRAVKVCANPNCSWMFVDQSKPGTRRWCNPGVCGSLANVRRFRSAHKPTRSADL
jgi:predicted RNA-binding Zn ribbon-like protein